MERHEAILAMFWVLVVISIALVFLVAAHYNREKLSAKDICLENGFPIAEYGNRDHWYCVKRTDCEDIVVSVELLRTEK